MPNTLREQVGERITVLREARGLSQRDLSDELAKLGLVVRRETITQWENGTRDLKTEYLTKLSEFFGTVSRCRFVFARPDCFAERQQRFRS